MFHIGGNEREVECIEGEEVDEAENENRQTLHTEVSDNKDIKHTIRYIVASVIYFELLQFEYFDIFLVTSMR